jgi:hypothetical protein
MTSPVVLDRAGFAASVKYQYPEMMSGRGGHRNFPVRHALSRPTDSRLWRYAWSESLFTERKHGTSIRGEQEQRARNGASQVQDLLLLEQSFELPVLSRSATPWWVVFCTSPRVPTTA